MRFGATLAVSAILAGAVHSPLVAKLVNDPPEIEAELKDRLDAKQDAAAEKARRMLETAKNDVTPGGSLSEKAEKAMEGVHSQVQACLQKWFMAHEDEQPSPDVINQCYNTTEEGTSP